MIAKSQSRTNGPTIKADLRSDQPVEPLVTVGVRLPPDLKSRLESEAKERGITKSDVFRSYIDLADAKPLGHLVPQRREKILAEVSGADPQLLRLLASLGNNLNQIAHTVNFAILSCERVSVLAAMAEIEQSLGAIAKAETLRAHREKVRISRTLPTNCAEKA